MTRSIKRCSGCKERFFSDDLKHFDLGMFCPDCYNELVEGEE